MTICVNHSAEVLSFVFLDTSEITTWFYTGNGTYQ